MIDEIKRLELGEVASALYKGFDLSAEKTALAMWQLLRNDDDMYKKVASALVSGLDFAGGDGRLDCVEHKVARALSSKEGPAWRPVDVFFAFYENGYAYSDIVSVLHHGLGLTIKETARLLYIDASRKTGTQIDEFDLARAIRDGFALTEDNVARVLTAKDGLSFSTERVARILHAPIGLQLNKYDVALVLHKKSGLGLDVETVARVLYSKDGLKLNAESVACVLYRRKGLDLTATKVARVMQSIGMEEHEIARAFYSRDGLNFTAGQVAIVLADKEGLNRSEEDVARVLSSKEGLNLPAEKVSRVLRECWPEAPLEPTIPCDEEFSDDDDFTRKEDRDLDCDF